MDVEIRNARIESTMLGLEDHGIFTANLTFDYGDHGHQGFGGWTLGNKEKYHPCCGHFIQRMLDVVGVDSWEDIPNRLVRVKREDGFIVAIGNALKDDWFDPREEFKQYNDRIDK